MSVIEYEGKRGRVWRIKYRDASGAQRMETVGAERDGFTHKQAKAELRERLVRVERKGYVRPKPTTFNDFAKVYFREGAQRRQWRPGTVRQYRVVEARLIEAFGPMPLSSIRPRHISAYVAALSKPTPERLKGYGASTIGRDLSTLHSIFAAAVREEVVESNPAAGAERPKLAARRWRILSPVEVGRVARAFTDAQARVCFLTLVQTGLRRSELQRLRWRDVELANPDGAVLRVRESKSAEGVRSIALAPKLAEELWQHRRAAAFSGDDERVFCHPELGSEYRANVFRDAFHAALKAAGVEGYCRPFHDLRHASLTLGAASGENAVALMARAGDTNMATTRGYLHLAGTVFPAEAEALERRLLGGDTVESSTNLGESESTQEDAKRLDSAPLAPAA